MGMEISEEFRPITPVKTVSTAARSTRSFVTKLFDLEKTSEVARCGDDDEECRTPRSPAADDILKQPLVCPPAPKKSRPVKRKFSTPSQGFFQVPDNLESIFLPLSKPPSSKKIRGS